MTKHIRNTFLCLTAVVALVALAAAPAFAHHKDGHETGKAADDGAATEEETTEQEATSGGSESRSERTARSNSNQADEPDPEPSQAPPSTTGPLECPDYSEEDNGPYDHDSCDTSSGQHGTEGNGKCAGCTGKADDKSPGGQSRNDHNNGYECDHNGGVGKGNPPHARCPQEPPVTTELCPEGSDRAGVPVNLVESCDEVEGEVVKRCPPGTDRAGKPMVDLEDCDVRGITDRVLPRIIRPGPLAPEPNPLGAVLPFTGAGDLYFAIALGMLLITAGAVGMRLRKN